MSPPRVLALLVTVTVAAAMGFAGCGGSSATTTSAPKPGKAAGSAAPAKDASPAGDIPDNQAYVAFSPATSGYSVKVPEGWSRRDAGRSVTFTDKLNAIRVETMPVSVAPTVGDVRRTVLPKLKRTVRGYRPGHVSAVTRHAGLAIRTTYFADAPTNPVTGKAGTDAVERYVFHHRGTDLVLTLSGPRGADNVDPWRIVSDSVRFTR